MQCLTKEDLNQTGLSLKTNYGEPVVGINDVKIKVLNASVCGTDKSIFLSNTNQGIREEMLRYTTNKNEYKPIVIGHEFCGIVEEIGAGVNKENFASLVPQIEIGDYVTAEMHLNCGSCNLCASGQAHICTHVLVKGVHLDGCFADKVVVPHQNIIMLGKGGQTKLVPPKIGSMLDAFGNAVHCVSKVNLAGKTVAVLGLGPLGLMTIILAKQFGASRIYATETTDIARRFALANEFGASHCFDVSSGTSEFYQTLLKQERKSMGVDCVFEMSGSPYAYNDAFNVVCNGGKVILLGISRAPLQNFDIAKNIIWKGVSVEGIFGRVMYSTWTLMLNLLESSGDTIIPKLEKILSSKTYTLSEYNEAFDKLVTGAEMKLTFSLN